MMMLRDNCVSFYNVAPLGNWKYSEDRVENIALGDPDLFQNMEDELNRRWGEISG